MNTTDTASLLNRLRDGWLASVGPASLVPGPLLDARGIEELASSTGWTGRHLSEAIRLAFAPFDEESIDRLFRPVKIPRGPRRPPHSRDLLAILAGRIPALAAKVVFHGLAGGMQVVLKPSSAEPVFARLLVRSLIELDETAPVSMAPLRGPALELLTRSASACLVYGSDQTTAAIVAQRPGRPTLTGPHMESLSVVFASATGSLDQARAVAEKLAWDATIYDQSGCLSPVAVLVQEGGAVSARQFGRMLLDAMLASPFEIGRCTAQDLAPVRMFLQEAPLMGVRDSVLTGPEGIPPAVVCCNRVRSSPGWRTIQVASFDSPVPDLGYFLPEMAGRVQGMSVAGTQGEISWLLRKNPTYRANHICDPGELQAPPALWHENGIVLAHELLHLP